LKTTGEGTMSKTHSVVPRLLTLREAATALGVPRWRLYELCKKKKIPSMKIGKTYRFSEAALAEWIVEQHQSPTGEDVNPERR
jgi:excisionase family DNA binding protein